jgi:threonine/homoserine/homoserine lactone efflux protein
MARAFVASVVVFAAGEGVAFVFGAAVAFGEAEGLALGAGEGEGDFLVAAEAATGAQHAMAAMQAVIR